jgi:hypothetical protein
VDKYCNKHADDDGVVSHILTFKNGYLITNKGNTLALKVLLEKRSQCNLETHFPFLAYEKALDEVRRTLVFGIVQNRNTPNQLLTAITSIKPY